MRVAAWVFIVAVGWSPVAAGAAEWTIVKLHGMVYAEGADGGWVRLSRGDAVADSHVIRTLRNGNAVLARGAETISLGPETRAEITDRPGRRPFTTVREATGSIGVAAEAKAVKHFSVETPYLVAVVKGTRFTVSTTDEGSRVAVERGLVSVTMRGNRRTVLLPAGQHVLATRHGSMLISGTAVPALVHPEIGGVIEDAGNPVGAPVPAPAGTSPGAAVGGTIAALGGATGAITALGDATGAALTGTTDAAGGLVQSAGNAVGSLGSAAGPLGPAVSAAGSTVSGLGGAVGAVGAAAGGAVTGLTQSGGGGGGTGPSGLLHLGF